jgi:DNA integrity scanning protein DisA with diadenylate cyclase activity
MIKAIEELNRYKARLNTVLSELETLEDGVDADYQDVIIDLRWVVMNLENRRESLQKRGRYV